MCRAPPTIALIPCAQSELFMHSVGEQVSVREAGHLFDSRRSRTLMEATKRRAHDPDVDSSSSSSERSHRLMCCWKNDKGLPNRFNDFPFTVGIRVKIYGIAGFEDNRWPAVRRERTAS